MSFTKVEIYNLTLSALLLAEEVIDIETNKSNNISILNRFYNVALWSTLQDLDLDSLSQPIILELLAELTEDESQVWDYAYKYPSNCAFLRRIESGVVTDNKSTQIAKRVAIYDGQKAIYTNEYQAVIECIPKDVPLEAMSAMAGMALVYKLAFLSAPLVVGKGAKSLRKELKEDYVIAKLEAQETDSRENFNYEPEFLRSEFVEERIS